MQPPADLFDQLKPGKRDLNVLITTHHATLL
jgi:hypothetical protein